MVIRLGWVNHLPEAPAGIQLPAEDLSTEPGQYKWRITLGPTNVPQGTGRRLVIMESETYKQTLSPDLYVPAERIIFVDTFSI